MIKIAIVGTHGVGKSFLREALYREACNRNPEVYVEQVKEVVRSCPFPVNEKTSLDSSFWIVARQIEMEMDAKSRQCELLICDRTPMDPIIYLMRSEVQEERAFRDMPGFFDLKWFSASWIPSYDHIIYVRPHKTYPIEPDGFRMTEKKKQLEIDEEFLEFFDNYGSDYAKDLVILNASDIRKWRIPSEKEFQKLCDRVFCPGKEEE